MGYINFTYDNNLRRTFGAQSDDDSNSQLDMIAKRDLVTDLLAEQVDSDFFTPVISNGYRDGFVIHTKVKPANDGLSDSASFSENSEMFVNHIIDAMRFHQDNQALLIQFMNDGGEGAERRYIKQLVKVVAEEQLHYKGGLIEHDYFLTTAIANHGIKFSDYDICCDDFAIDKVMERIYKAINPTAIADMAKACIEADLDCLESEILDIALHCNLMELQGKSWTLELKPIADAAEA